MADTSHPTPAPSAAPTGSAAGAALATLVRWAAGVRYDDLPDDVRRRALLVLADDLGAMIAVRDDPQVTAVRDSLVTPGQAPEATVFAGGRVRGERAAVAAANGAAADWAELDEGYRPATCHAGLYVLPALLAEAEARELSGEQVVAALVAGYEVVTRVARTWRHERMTIHPHALLGPIGAAAGAAFASGLEPDECVAAVAGGATTAMMGPFDHAVSGAMVRNVWTGIAAWTGIQLARWAPHGIGGDPSAPHSAFATAMGATADLDQLTADLGATWGIRDGYHKLFACCQYAHSTVEALLEIRAEDPAIAEPGLRRSSWTTRDPRPASRPSSRSRTWPPPRSCWARSTPTPARPTRSSTRGSPRCASGSRCSRSRRPPRRRTIARRPSS
jgi:2-methylcitrate dehydratase PrpD